MPNWIVFARKGKRPWPYRPDFFPQEYTSKVYANQCRAAADEFGAIFSEIVASGRFKAEVDDMKHNVVVRCNHDKLYWVVQPTPYTDGQFNLSQIKCPRCNRGYVADNDVTTSERPLTILHHPHW